jgi:TonB family protein
MPHALLLSPDDQAVSAITAVLEEMSVTCERPLDGVSAAQKLNSQTFDLVLVDCENLPAAKLIFDVCRRGKNGNNPVPIAIVDGRAGLPTAFRLGAELILTKPVAKDQARTTIRTAVGRVKKDVPVSESIPVQPANNASPSLATTIMPTSERAQSAAAAASSHLASFSDSASSAATSTLSAAAATTALESIPASSLHTAIGEVKIDDPASTPDFGSDLHSKLKPAALLDSPLSESSPASAASAKLKFPVSDDPVLAELERAELEESDAAELKAAETLKQGSENLSQQKSEPTSDRIPEKHSEQSSQKLSAKDLSARTPDHEAAKAGTQVFSSYQGRPKPRGTMVALFVLFLACAGFYAAWTYQPGFRAIVQPQVDHALQLAGIVPASTPVTPAPASVRPAAVPAAAAPALVAADDKSKTPATASDSVTDSTTPSATGSTAGSSTASAPGKPVAVPNATITPSTALASGSAATAAPASTKLEASKAADSKSAIAKKDATATPSPDVPLPGESSAIILSSKGAEKRLAYSIAPKYPAEARTAGAEGTILLKEVVNEAGKVEGVRLVDGNPALATAAISAVKQWRYRPYVRDGKPQPFQTVVIIDFQRP